MAPRRSRRRGRPAGAAELVEEHLSLEVGDRLGLMDLVPAAGGRGLDTLVNKGLPDRLPCRPKRPRCVIIRPQVRDRQATGVARERACRGPCDGVRT